MWQERELKFVLDDGRAPGFLAVASAELETEIHDPALPVAYSRTTYLDTDDGALLCAPDAVRRRLRVREYAAAPDLDTAPVLVGRSYLELKESNGGCRNKARVRLSPALLGRLLDGAAAVTDLVDLEQDDAALGGGLRAQRVRPQMTTWYRRTSLVAPGLRVTLDHGVAFCAPACCGAPGELACPSQTIARWPGTVLELKLAGELPAWLARELDGLVEAVGLSKFEAGMHALAARNTKAA